MREEVSKEEKYRQAKKDWDNYKSWKDGRNKDRAELEEKFGYDVKHASHLVRLMHEGEELLSTGNITLPRPEAALLRKVKAGGFSYDELIIMVSGFSERLDELYEKSELPYTPDHEKVNKLYLSILSEYHNVDILGLNRQGGEND